ncbi:transcriptional adapter 3-B isoform X2 [Anthonomus grandis grandis]|uniref:transcriptional adapter 3-B isoform X2 n=1 Tax=Anthonomus grandis grandis TaxID=2921223 RepID=UPI0021659D02|nr:transcriptional adapter 3-B isoform X2 [Anthonomus grandis grandis]
MISSKRSSLTSSKGSNKCNGKLKEILSSSSKPKTAEPKVPDIKDLSNIPVINQADNARVLPKYTALLLKTSEEGVSMEDIDQLQQDLEKLLCTNAIRTRFFMGEYTQADQKDGDKKNSERMSLKRKRPDEKLKYKEIKNGLRLIKKGPFKAFNDKTFKEVPKITLPRNDNSDKFWASIEPYCAPVTKDDVNFLDGLIQEFSKEIDKKIPELGEHYASSWSGELMNDEQNLGKSNAKRHAEIRRHGMQTLVHSFGAPHTQRLLHLIQEKASKIDELKSCGNKQNGSKTKKIKSSEISELKQHIGQKIGFCIEKRLLRELVEQGILTQDVMYRDIPDDEILTEIKKCQQELLTVNKYNVDELHKLRTAVLNDIHCNQLKVDLDKIDKEVLDLYNNIKMARMQEEGKDYDQVFTVKMIAEYERKANALLRQQHVLNREINSMTNMSMLY